MLDKLMYITNDDTQNYPFCRIRLLVAYGHSTWWMNQPEFVKSLKLLGQRIRKLIIKLWEQV